MKALLRRAGQLAETRQQRMIARIAGHLSRTWPGDSVVAEIDRIVVSGRGIGRRWLLDPALRFVRGHVG